jgi:hypothetical protein
MGLGDLADGVQAKSYRLLGAIVHFFGFESSYLLLGLRSCERMWALVDESC